MSLRAEQEKILSKISQEKNLDNAWEVYRNMYYLRLRDSLSVDFSETQKLDENSFSDWTDGFIYSVKSDSPDIAELSSKFPGYLLEILDEDKKWMAEFAKREHLQLQSWLLWQPIFQPEIVEDLSLQLKLSEHVILFQSMYAIDENKWFIIYSTKDNMHWESVSEEEFAFLQTLNRWTSLEKIEKSIPSEVILKKFSDWISKSLFSWNK